MSKSTSVLGRAPGQSLISSVTFVRSMTIVVVVATWEVLARSGVVFKGVVPSITEIAPAFLTLLATPSFYQNLGLTVVEVLAGFLLGTL